MKPLARGAARGEVHTWLVLSPPVRTSFQADAPYIGRLVDMDAGLRISAPAARVAESDLRSAPACGVAFDPVNKDVTLPYFGRPVIAFRKLGDDVGDFLSP